MIQRVLMVCAGFFLLIGDAAAKDLYWYLASSMVKPGKDIVAKYHQKQTLSRIFLIIGGSGQLLSKIELAGQGDIYTPASVSFLDRAREKGLVRTERLLLYQTPVFGVSQSGRAKIKTFNDLLRPGIQLALGNPKTMALGATYLQVEEKMGRQLSGQIRANSRLEAINISQIVNYLLSDVVDAGLISDTVARANQLYQVDIPEKFVTRSAAFIIRLACSTAEEAELERFETFILNQHLIFNKYGFQLAGDL
ncbi:MAG: substrate-binding domain-containing protein [SAR324 cluster bacterium]|nr:substrate-binding domain-containing protein [SAR324 cluster bacterium]